MLHLLLIFTNVGLLLSIALLHFYWAFGGKWAVDYTIPDKFKDSYFNDKNKTRIAIATLVVALGLIVFAAIIASNYFNFEALIKPNWTIILTRIIGGIFLLRAIGDFNIVGIFKKQKSGKFAAKDSQLFIPICLYLGITAILISLISLT